MVRAWGRIGTRGRIKIDSYITGEGAAAAFTRLEEAKRRRGYLGQGAGISHLNANQAWNDAPETVYADALNIPASPRGSRGER